MIKRTNRADDSEEQNAMAKKKKLEHDEWMANQLKKLRSTYRDALLHASFIEGVICNKSKSTRREFYHAIQWLHIHKKITDKERDALHEVRKARNKLVHDIVKKEASQEQIEEWRDDLMNKVREAYKMSTCLNDELLTKYNIL